MEIKLNEQNIKENFGEVILLGTTARHPYNPDTRERDESVIESLVAHLSCSNFDESIDVLLENKQYPNVKKWGKVKFVDLVYSPSATANTFQDNNGNQRSYARVNDRFVAKSLEPFSASERLADENGEKQK